MGGRVKWLAILLILTATGSFAEAQIFPLYMPWNIKVDSSVRLEFLFGTQILRDTDVRVPGSNTFIVPNAEGYDRFRIQYGPRVPLAEGFVELSPPVGPLSIRLGGWASFLEPRIALDRTVGHVSPTPTSLSEASRNVKPDVWAWEAAGLYHVFEGLGHRFSFTAGFRREEWHYSGELSSDASAVSSHSFSSYIPFIGLQSAMLFPWWRARFEVLGSQIMVQQISHFLQDGNTFVDYRGKATGTGMIQLSMEGTVNVSPACWFGGFLRYSFQEMYGTATGRTSASTATGYSRNFYVGQSFATVGLNATLLF